MLITIHALVHDDQEMRLEVASMWLSDIRHEHQGVGSRFSATSLLRAVSPIGIPFAARWTCRPDPFLAQKAGLMYPYVVAVTMLLLCGLAAFAFIKAMQYLNEADDK